MTPLPATSLLCPRDMVELSAGQKCFSLGIFTGPPIVPPPQTDKHIAPVPPDVSGHQRRVVTGGISWRRTFSAFQYRNYRLYFIGQLVSLIGTWMTNTAQGWLVYQLTGSKALLGIVAAAGTAPMLFFSTWGGWAADRFPKRSVLICTQTVMMILAFIFAGLVWSGQIVPWEIIVLGLLGGVVMAFDMPARQSFVVEIASREDLMNAISLNSAMFNGARIVGPAIAGFLMAKVGIALCFFIDGASFIAVLVGLFLMRVTPPPRSGAAGGALAQSLEGFRYVWNHTRVRTIFALFAVVGVFGWSYSVLMPAFAHDILHLGEQGYGLLLGAIGVGALVGALATAAFGSSISSRRLAFGGVWLFSAMLFIFSLNRNLTIAMICLAGAGFGMMLFFSTSNTTVQTIVPDEMRGRVMGIWSLIFGGMIPFGSLEAGAVAHYFGTPATLTVGAIVCALAGGVTYVIVRRRDAQLAQTANLSS
ncbi:MAG: MFS transporter [Chthoniobacterales bacterium]|nr:MFS transporter [Chthoniobacterales bacterium]